jgi:hypothetical protein
VAAVGLDKIAKAIRSHGLELSGYCRGGMFPATDAAGLRAALPTIGARSKRRKPWTRRASSSSSAACPARWRARLRDLTRLRAQVHDGIAATLEYARSVGMPLAIEPLHPMYAADRACVNTMEQALDLCNALDPQKSGALGVEGSERAALGVAVDVYHVWWDPKPCRHRSHAPVASGCSRFTSATGSCLARCWTPASRAIAAPSEIDRVTSYPGRQRSPADRRRHALPRLRLNANARNKSVKRSSDAPTWATARAELVPSIEH